VRSIQTFILRLLADSDEPQALRGMIRSVTNDSELSFTDESSLLAVLRRLAETTIEGPNDREQDQNAGKNKPLPR